MGRSLGRSPAACRQLGARARRRIEERRQRFDADLRQGRALTDRFLVACATGDLSGLLSMLSDDVVVWTDGGGKVRAAMRPVVGPYRSSRFLLNVAKKVHGLPHATVLNGQPATVFVDGDTVVAALVLDIMDGSIVGVRSVTNPDKLARLSARRWPQRRLADRGPTRRPRGTRGVERAPPDLARRRAGEVVDQHELLRGRPGSHAVGDHLTELVERRAVVGGHDPGHDPLAPFRIGALPDSDLGHARVRHRMRSTASGQTFSAPVVMTSSMRPETTSFPSPSRRPASPVANQSRAPSGPTTRPSSPSR